MMVTVVATGGMRRIGLGAVKGAAAVSDRARRPGGGIVILAYHRVGRRSELSVDLPEWLFAEQMARLAAGPGVVDLDTAVDRLAAGTPLGAPAGPGPAPRSPAQPDPVVVTFDDGTADFVEVALPILALHRVPATVYVATEFIETGRPFPNSGSPTSWSALADAVATGLVTVGSHTHTHALLDRLPSAAVAGELDRSIGLIGERLGVAARHFAYPKALPGSPAADAAVRARFASAALAGTRANPYGRTDPHRLARSPLQVEDGLGFFARKAAGGMRLEDDLRRLAGRRRFASATT